LRAGGEANVFNCGYSKGYSVLEVLDAVKRVAGKDMDIRYSPRRPGDPAAIVAASSKIRDQLGWIPEHDDLDRIVAQALAWEAELARRTNVR
jgi:UDP-glucose 4-epimerase